MRKKRDYTVSDALEDLDTIDSPDERADKNGWIVIDEDNCLDPFSSIDYLKEDLDKEEFSSVHPCDIIYCRTEVQHLDEPIKSRPMVDIIAVDYNGVQKVKGFQITGEPAKEGGYRNQFRYPLKDWSIVGLNKPSYVNYDHIVSNVDQHINFGTTGKQFITKRDAKGLLEAILANYDELLRLGYSSPTDQSILKYFITELKRI